MLIAFSAVVVGCLVASLVLARASVVVVRRLGLDPMTVLLWLGLAEWPNDQPRATRQRLGATFLPADRPAA